MDKKQAIRMLEILKNMDKAKTADEFKKAKGGLVGSPIALTFISNEDFNEELVSQFKREKEITLKNNSEKGSNGIMPKLLILGLKDESGKRPAVLVMVAGDFNEGDMKRKIMFGMGAKMAEDIGGKPIKPIAVYLTSEAWIAMEDPSHGGILQKDEEGNPLPPSEQPTRGECLIVAGRTIDGRGNMATSIFKRVKGKIFFTEEPTIMNYEAKSGNKTESALLDEFFKGYVLASGLKDMGVNLPK